MTLSLLCSNTLVKLNSNNHFEKTICKVQLYSKLVVFYDCTKKY